jgi:hypothetical protein
MTSNISSRRTAGAITAALVLGTAGPAVARTIEDPGPVPVAPPAHVAHKDKANAPPPFVRKHVKRFPEATAAPVPAATPRAVVNRPGTGGGPDAIYILVGGAAVALSGLGGAFVAANRRRTSRPRPRIAA